MPPGLRSTGTFHPGTSQGNTIRLGDTTTKHMAQALDQTGGMGIKCGPEDAALAWLASFARSAPEPNDELTFPRSYEVLNHSESAKTTYEAICQIYLQSPDRAEAVRWQDKLTWENVISPGANNADITQVALQDSLDFTRLEQIQADIALDSKQLLDLLNSLQRRGSGAWRHTSGTVGKLELSSEEYRFAIRTRMGVAPPEIIAVNKCTCGKILTHKQDLWGHHLRSCDEGNSFFRRHELLVAAFA